jgi:hypothetical protein
MRNDIHRPEVGDLLQSNNNDDVVLILEKTLDNKSKCMVVYASPDRKPWSVTVGSILKNIHFYKDAWEIL